ncbi:MAG: DUF4249 domain-containing protein [Saprospiraceae bacterium]
MKVKNSLNALIIIILSLPIYGCNGLPVTTIEIATPKEPSKMIIHAYFLNTDTALWIHLHKSTSLFELDTLESGLLGDLAGATAQLFNDNGLLSSFQYGLQGNPQNILNYSSHLAAPLETYGSKLSIKVNHPAYAEITSTQFFPTHVPIESAKLIKNAGIVLSNGENSHAIQITFKDPAQEANFYQVRIVSRLPNDQTDRSILRVSSSDPIFTTGEFGRTTLEVSDESFDGSSYIFNFFLMEEIPEEHLLYFTWRTITKEWYEYIKSNRQQFVSNGFLNNFSEPLNIISNVEGGLGIFGLGTEEKILLQE